MGEPVECPACDGLGTTDGLQDCRACNGTSYADGRERDACAECDALILWPDDFAVSPDEDGNRNVCNRCNAMLEDRCR